MYFQKLAKFVLVLLLLGCSQYSGRQLYLQTYKSLNGIWVHSEDSHSTAIVKNQYWTFYYSGEPSHDTHQIRLTNSLPQYADEKTKGEFLLLIQKSDTTFYEIMGLSDSILSLMHFPSGRINVYHRRK